LSSGWQANGAATQARTRLSDTPDLQASEHNPERPVLRLSRRLIQ
jgi:cytochrome c-type biogenesis protein CcmH/NrfG